MDEEYQSVVSTEIYDTFDPIDMKKKIKNQIKEHLIKWYHLSDDSLKNIKNDMSKEFELGLRDEDSATIKMLVTYVRELSRGDEVGSYLALDLGGTHFRVLLVEMTGEGDEPCVTTVVHDIPAELLTTSNGQLLFDYIALKLLEFVQQHKLKRRRISLGFTFSFPCKQYGLTQSYLVKWCKGFSVGGVVGTDVVKQLKDALKRQLAGLCEAYVDVVAVLNDTTGTLVACAFKNRECRIGLILGTGFNACYMERLDRCEKWPANYTNPKQVIINCEWGAMGDNKDKRELDKYRNEFDAIVDQQSVNAHSQTLEKMVGGMYVGELLRLTILKLYQNRILFQASKPKSGVSLTSIQQKSPASVSSAGTKLQETLGSPAANKSKSSIGSAIKSLGQPLQASSSAENASTQSTLASGTESHKLNIKNILNGRHLSMLAKDEISGTHDEAIKMLKELNITTYSVEDLNIVVEVGAAIILRCAYLVAVGVSCLLERMQRPHTVIGYDGSLIKQHPYLLKRVIEKTAQLTSKEYRFDFVQSSDGSGVGAAVVAAALHKERRPLYVVKPGKLYEMHFSIKTQHSLLGTESGATLASQKQTSLSKIEKTKKG